MKTLFLDRDGVLNKRIVDDYVRSVEMWEWLPGAKEAFRLLKEKFGRILIVSNQQGVGKGLFSEADLQALTHFFVAALEEAGGHIDAVYYCTHLKADNCECRKPLTGMALRAQQDFPDIDFAQSVMLGDSLSDMEFGKKLGMRTVFVCTEGPPADYIFVDETVASLGEFAQKTAD